MYTTARPSARSRFEKDYNNQRQIDNLVAVGLLDAEPRSNVKKKRNVEFKETSTKLRQPIIAALFVCLHDRPG
jgi:hypothetical protein